jgi:hypothetical protein
MAPAYNDYRKVESAVAANCRNERRSVAAGCDATVAEVVVGWSSSLLRSYML